MDAQSLRCYNQELGFHSMPLFSVKSSDMTAMPEIFASFGRGGAEEGLDG